MKSIQLITIINLLLCASCFSTKKLSPNKIRSGVVQYDIKVESPHEMMSKNFGTKATAIFNEELLKFSKNSEQTGFEYQMTDLKTGAEWNFLNWMGKKFRIPPDPATTPKLQPPIYHDSYKIIAGFNCQKIRTPMNDGEMVAYITKEIEADYCPYLKVDGFALEYQLTMPFGKVTYTATEFEAKEIRELKMDESYKTYPSLRAFQNDLAAPTAELTGRPFPDFKLEDAEGKLCSATDVENKVVVYNFWFTECPPCISEIPDLNKLKANYVGQEVAFLAVTFDPNKKVAPFLEKHPFDFRILTAGNHLIKALEIGAFPTSLVVNKNGTIVYAETGGSFSIFESLSEVIDRTLKE